MELIGTKGRLNLIAAIKLVYDKGYRRKAKAVCVESGSVCREIDFMEITNYLLELVGDDDDAKNYIVGDTGCWQAKLKKNMTPTKLPFEKIEASEDEDTLFSYNQQGNCKINTALLVVKLKELGYRMLASDDRNRDALLCLDSNNILNVVSPDVMRDDILAMTPKQKEQSAVYDHNKICNGEIVHALDRIKFKPYKDNIDSCSFFFRNGVLRITKDGVNMVDIKDFDFGGCKVWGSNTIDRDVDMSLFSNYKNGEFYKFCNNVVGSEGLPYLMRAIGYLMHSYKNPSNAFAIMFSEADVKSNSTKNGGTGKSIIASCFKYMRSYSFINGKSYDSNNTFNMQTVDRFSDVLLMDDVNQDFKYESMYLSISNDMTIEKKGRTPDQIPFSQSPKIVITSNFGILTDGNSDERRQRVIGFKNHYHPDFTPRDDFGHNLFIDWNDEFEDEWQYFYGFITACVRLFLSDGIVKNYKDTIIKNKAWDNIFGENIRNFCFSSYNQFLGRDNAYRFGDIDDKVKDVVLPHHRGKAVDVFQKTMRRLGLSWKSYTKKKTNGSTERLFYFEIESMGKLNEALLAYDFPAFSESVMEATKEEVKRLEDLNLFNGDKI